MRGGGGFSAKTFITKRREFRSFLGLLRLSFLELENFNRKSCFFFFFATRISCISGF